MGIAAAVLAAVVIAGVVLANFDVGRQYRSFKSVKQLNDYPFYTMTNYTDYDLEGLLEAGAGSMNDIIDFTRDRYTVADDTDMKMIEAACSCYHASSPEGEDIMGRNFDFDYSPALLLHTNPKQGYESISMVNLLFLGISGEIEKDSQYGALLAAPYAPMDGMNEKGVCIGLMELKGKRTAQDTGKTKITSTVMMRAVLDRAANVDEAVAIFETYDMQAEGADYHYLISDAYGKSAIIEYYDHEMKVMYNENPYQVSTNFYIIERLEAGKKAACGRYRKMEKVLSESNGIISEEDGMELLYELSNHGDVSFENRTKAFQTQWSCIYNLDRLTVDICIGENYDEKYEFELK